MMNKQLSIMITEDYVSFETAKLLKENGFDERCFSFYWPDGSLDANSHDKKTNLRNSTSSNPVAPTLQMAMKWLRKNYNIEIDTPSNYKNTDHNSIEYSAIVTKYIFGGEAKTYPILNPSRYDSYELAEEAAIKYCLENLI